MLFRCLCLLSGAYSLGLFRALPADEFFLPLSLLAGISLYRPDKRFLAWFMLGFLSMWAAAWIVIDDRLDSALQGETISILVRVDDFPTIRDESLRFIAQQDERPDLPARIRLSWYEPELVPGVGEVWRLRVRLRRPHGYANPAGFDYEGWLFRQRIAATGYVVAHKDNRRIAETAIGMIPQIRRRFVERVTQLLPEDDAAAVLLAVGVGARHRITREQWDRYATTGTSHLMAISGLHIGLAASGVFLLAWAFYAPFCRRTNVRDMALLTAVLAAGVYAAVSGLAVPSRRAFLMAAFAAFAVLLRRKLNVGALLGIPCTILFFAEPTSIHAPGFKLSFAAVGILFWLLQGYFHQPMLRGGPLVTKAVGNLRRLGVLQIALLTGLFPLTVLIFGRVSVIAPLMNLLVLPLFNFITVPFCLIGMIFDGPAQAFGDRFLVIAYQSIRAVLALVSTAADMPSLRAEVLPPAGLLVVIALLPILNVVFPAGWPGRKLVWISMVSVFLYRPSPPPFGCMDYHVLDVGQGLAVVVRTEDHTVLFDTGPSFRSGSSTAELVVMPFLKLKGIKFLDTLVISHADQDHAGGVAAIANQFDIGTIFVGETLADIDLLQTGCNTAAAWASANVQFRFVHPLADASWEGNNASCVLEVAVGNFRLLLTGDIEAAVEATLVEQSLLGSVNTVVVPHHGSRTSSSTGFVSQLSADIAIVSAGFGNRWGFPKADVVRRWEHAGAQLLETATSGAISQRICRDTGPEKLRLARQESQNYWHEI